ncbi:hypothetical protein [Burkholderia gladioli]|uniref:hypothetical protein n=1 Tax=Burkholderia gladioli TaxID=28095 RepID=UPI00163FBAC3|nr:hypothetical protein [Burkholderia gladioli]
MRLDRQYQLELLQMMAERYPLSLDIREVIKTFDEVTERRYAATMTYLIEHGLATGVVDYDANWNFSFGNPKITAHGMDFLADDGGLTAILGVVTVKFHDETLKAVIGQKIEESELPPADKRKWLDALRSLPAETTKHLTLKLVDAGLAHAPGALHAIQTYLSAHL